MQLLTKVDEVRSARERAWRSGHRVAFVPTMGALHKGHLGLVRAALGLGDQVWVSVFVNPTQFGPDEDFDHYPRDLKADAAQLERAGANIVFAPPETVMYPRRPVVAIGFPGLATRLCGASRPGHFAGVGLVVAKLFNIVQPDVALFGQKDAQQALLIKRLTEDLNFPVRISVAPTVREPDGLALSSRNAYLSADQRRAAPVLHRALLAGREMIAGGETDGRTVELAMAEHVAEEPLVELEYAACVDLDTLTTCEHVDGPVLLAVAADLGGARLIDNVLASPDGRHPETLSELEARP